MTKFHDARIETRVEKEIRDKFYAIAKAHHITPSELNRLLLIQFVNGKVEMKFSFVCDEGIPAHALFG